MYLNLIRRTNVSATSSRMIYYNLQLKHDIFHRKAAQLQETPKLGRCKYKGTALHLNGNNPVPVTFSNFDHKQERGENIEKSMNSRKINKLSYFFLLKNKQHKKATFVENYNKINLHSI